MPGLLSRHIRAVRRGGDGPHPQLRASVSALCAMGVTRAHAPGAEHPAPSLLPAPSRPREEGTIPLQVYRWGNGAPARGGPWPAVTPRYKGDAGPHQPCPADPSPLPRRQQGWGRKSQAAGRQGWRRAGGGTPTGSGIVPGAAIQRNTGCQALPPDNCGLCGGSRRSRAHSWEGRGSKVQAEGPALRPGPQGCCSVGPAATPARATPMAGSLLHAQLVFKVPSRPFRALPTLRLARMAPPPGSPSLPNPGQMPPFQLTQPLWVSPTAALTSRSLPHQTGSEPPCTGLGGEVSPLKQFQGPLTHRTP